MRLTYLATATLIAGLASPFVASAQQNMPADFLKARGERVDALAKGDRATFDRLTAATFIVTDAQGRVENKAERGARVVPPATPPQGPPAARENETMAMYNNDTVVIHWNTSQQGGMNYFTETWVKDGGQWKCAAAHVSRVAPGGAGGREGGGREGGRGRQ
jgi:Domain of unknown function (DUF4440)